jgi:trans-2,3-dihydro-3-hydroxyanthranilate isomerase
MARRFVTLDVFTATPHAGNPLAVVLDSDGLDTAAMQAIAREFNLSETVFVQPAAEAGHRAAIRIFTPGRELPFAGHPTVGTAVLLALRDRTEGRGADILVLEEQIGRVPCAVAVSGERSGQATFTLPRLPPPSPPCSGWSPAGSACPATARRCSRPACPSPWCRWPTSPRSARSRSISVAGTP